LADVTQWTYWRRIEGASAANASPAAPSAASASRRSSGTTSSCALVGSESQSPLALAASITARPAGVMRPSAMSLSTRALFDSAHTPPGRRGEKRSACCRSSMRLS